MLAAFECFGDWGSWSLKYLAKRLLKMEVASYREMVGSVAGLLAVPFKDVVSYSCSHADSTLQLFQLLEEKLRTRGLERQYRETTLTMLQKLGNWEYEGIPVDLEKLVAIRDRHRSLTAAAEKRVVSSAGATFNLNSAKEISAVLRKDAVLGCVVGYGRISSRALEELAVKHDLPRQIVTYRRQTKLLRAIEALVSATKDGRVNPLFRQTKNSHGALAAAGPGIFIDDPDHEISLCFEEDVREHFPDSKRSLGILCDLTGDENLRRDQETTPESEGALERETMVPGNVDSDRLLVSILVGTHDSELCRSFFLDKVLISSIRHEFEGKYRHLFAWLDRYRAETLKRGFATTGSSKKHFDGLRSSNLERRAKALNSSVRWLLRY